MRTIQNQFRKDGFDYELIERNTVAAIFAQKSEGKVIAYEVIKIKIYPERMIAGKVLEAGEYYPSTGSWGTDAFTCQNIERARLRFNQFNDDAKKKLLCN